MKKPIIILFLFFVCAFCYAQIREETYRFNELTIHAPFGSSFMGGTYNRRSSSNPFIIRRYRTQTGTAYGFRDPINNIIYVLEEYNREDSQTGNYGAVTEIFVELYDNERGTLTGIRGRIEIRRETTSRHSRAALVSLVISGPDRFHYIFMDFRDSLYFN
jgi:hypothetical protein